VKPKGVIMIIVKPKGFVIIEVFLKNGCLENRKNMVIKGEK